MNRTECAFEQDWPLFQLGLIDPERRAEMQQHLGAGCPHCVAAHEESGELVSLIGLSAPQQRPSQNVEARLERRLRGPAAVPRSFRLAPLAWGLSFAAMAALIFTLAIERAQLREELVAEQQQAALLRDRTVRLTTALSRSAKVPQVPPESHVPATAPQVVVVKPDITSSIPPRQPEPVPAISASVPPVAPDQIAALARAQDELSTQLSDSRRRADLLEQKLRDAEARNSQLQEGAAGGQKLSGEVASLRSELKQMGDSREAYKRMLVSVGSGSVKSVNLRAIDPAAGKASARAILNTGSGLFIVAERMPALPANKCYQLWLIRNANPSIVSGGIMELNADGVAVLAAPHVDDESRITGLAITDEPVGGSVSARGHKLLFGMLK